MSHPKSQHHVPAPPAAEDRRAALHQLIEDLDCGSYGERHNVDEAACELFAKHLQAALLVDGGGPQEEILRALDERAAQMAPHDWDVDTKHCRRCYVPHDVSEAKWNEGCCSADPKARLEAWERREMLRYEKKFGADGEGRAHPVYSREEFERDRMGQTGDDLRAKHAAVGGGAMPPQEERSDFDSGLCCMSAHANATPPWTCSCVCHTREEQL